MKRLRAPFYCKKHQETLDVFAVQGTKGGWTRFRLGFSEKYGAYDISKGYGVWGRK
jgi:hypothetical protein